MQDQPKICKMCKHHYRLMGGSDWCERGKTIDLVTGSESNALMCADARSHGYVESILHNTCGKRGRFFEEKQ